MLLQHSILYFLIRGISGLVGLLSLVLFTRLLTPAEYGLYALALAGLGVMNVVFFQWLNIGIGRFMPAYQQSSQVILATVAVGFLCSLLITGILLGILLWHWPDRATRGVVLVSGLLGWGQAWFELTLRIANIRLDPNRYGLLSVGKAVLALMAGVTLVYLGYGIYGLLGGALAAVIVTSAVLGAKDWAGVRFHSSSAQLLSRILHYGAPLTVMYFLILVVDVSSRFFLGWYSGARDLGVYAATYDLVQWSLATLMGVINLAGFPLVVQALESKGVQAAESQLRQYASLMFGVGVPSLVGLCLLAENLVEVLFGANFHQDSAVLIPWLACGLFLACAKSFYFDLSFQLGRNTKWQAIVAACAAVVNVLLNVWWIPSHGAMGAAYSAVAAFGVGLLASMYLGARTFRLPPLSKNIYKIIVASVGMALVVWPSSGFRGLGALAFQLALGIVTYAGMLILLDVEGVRSTIARFSERIKSSASIK